MCAGVDDDAKLNAKYAISIARKLGATIFVLPEDITEVKSKMVSLFCDNGLMFQYLLCADLDFHWYLDGTRQVWGS